MAQYDYSKPAVDPAKPWETVDETQLYDEIVAAGILGLNGVTYDSVTVTVYTEPALDPADETTLDGVVAAHTVVVPWEYPYNMPAADPEKPWETVDQAQLESEIRDAGLTGLEGSTYDTVTLTILFDHELGPADVTTLDGVVAAYTPPSSSPIKLARYVYIEPLGDPRGINYATGLSTKLSKWIDTSDDTSWFRGEIRRVEYHSSPEHNDKVVQEVREWARSADGTVTVINPAAVWGDADFRGSRHTWTWYLEDNTAYYEIKTSIKTYNGMQSMTEGRKRRQGLLDALEAEVLRLLLGTGGTEADGMAYTAKYATELSTFVRTGDLSFKTPPANPNITDDTEPWLDNDVSGLGYPAGTTIRDVILDSLQGIMDP